ncbi:hypothetical protein ACIQOU_21220 [Streptomyces sp. NPDC091279]|uniref:hypothetical protein n=1 Tax=unclassified Streptomyces TaxID=2593676 RepID=UPI00380748AA
MFVDNSGRRSKMLRRIGLLLGALCLGYAGLLGLTFMGIGTSYTPSSLLPFAGGGQGPAGVQGGNGPGGEAGRPSGVPTAAPSGVPTPTASSSASASAAAVSN